jgi:ubiquinone/menaquinone biosynthesis C-methylase UbiE
MRRRKPAPRLRAIQEQFARQARRYAVSALHRYGDTLETVVRLADVRPGQRALDVGCGTGFTTFGLAPAAQLLIGTDPTIEMLEEARRLALETNVSGHIEWGLAVAEALPIAADSLDVVTSRFASHHFRDLPAALAEFARAVRTTGRVVICDVLAPESPAMVERMNQLELLRDPSHVWNYPLSQWRDELLPDANLRAMTVVQGKSPQAFRQWVQRAGTSPDAVRHLTDIFFEASDDIQRAFDIRQEGTEVYFAWDNVAILAEKIG